MVTLHLKHLLSEVSCVLKDNDTNMHLEKWGGRGKKELIQIPSVGHLKYDRFKHNVNQEHFIEQKFEAIFSNSGDSYLCSSITNLCRCLAETYEDEFISAAGDSSQMSAVETASIMSDVGLN